MIVKRECDIPMARSKRLLPCDKDCKNSLACIETTDEGVRRHCRRGKNFNIGIDMKLAAAGSNSEENSSKGRREQKPWTDMETERVIFLRELGLTWKEIGARMKRTWQSVRQHYNRIKEDEKST